MSMKTKTNLIFYVEADVVMIVLTQQVFCLVSARMAGYLSLMLLMSVKMVLMLDSLF